LCGATSLKILPSNWFALKEAHHTSFSGEWFNLIEPMPTHLRVIIAKEGDQQTLEVINRSTRFLRRGTSHGNGGTNLERTTSRVNDSHPNEALLCFRRLRLTDRSFFDQCLLFQSESVRAEVHQHVDARRAVTSYFI